MTIKIKILISFFVIGVIILVANVFNSNEVEIHALASVDVNLTNGWPSDPGNRVIGILPKGSVTKAVPSVVKDHMVYKVELQSSSGTQVGFVMFDGYCGGRIVEVRIRHHLFNKDEKILVGCLQTK